MLYCCEVCGKKHTSEEKALECERLHEEERARREELAKKEEERIKEIETAYNNLMDLVRTYNEDYHKPVEFKFTGMKDKDFTECVNSIKRIFEIW